MSTAANLEGDQFNRKKTGERRTSNVQHRTPNESILSGLKKIPEAIPSFGILRFAVYPGYQSGQSSHQETVLFWRSLI
jgi:hypothetical protein